jgi:hypothetical protein
VRKKGVKMIDGTTERIVHTIQVTGAILPGAVDAILQEFGRYVEKGQADPTSKNENGFDSATIQVVLASDPKTTGLNISGLLQNSSCTATDAFSTIASTSIASNKDKLQGRTVKSIVLSQYEKQIKY